ncbi:solute carrier family 25 member 48 [Limosa lapponica baueri]|uniref:Solute carrier family 25 member 48 n=1 Tax=Limosa lapponica baueri TaxID=1758121 RepID=A0A2I0TFU1_LIMLA|nr:solute carrier family 25 member 48 [Limosa lapponica baueri]
MLLARSLPRQLTKSDELPRDLEERDETTPPPSSPGDLEHVLLTRDSPEDLNTKLSLCNDRSVQVFALPYLPYYRTSYIFISPSSLIASHISTETEESFSDGKVNTKHDEEVSYSAVSTGYFPCYRTSEELLGQPLTYGLNTEEKKPDSDGKDESEGGCAQDVGDAEKSVMKILLITLICATMSFYKTSVLTLENWATASRNNLALVDLDRFPPDEDLTETKVSMAFPLRL